MTLREKIEVMQAYENKQAIEALYLNTWHEVANPTWNWECFTYRVKRVPKTRPYNSQEEFLEAQKKHGPYLYKRIGYLDIPVRVVPDGVVLLDHYSAFKNEATTDIYFWHDLSNEYHWQDGTPCNIIE